MKRIIYFLAFSLLMYVSVSAEPTPLKSGGVEAEQIALIKEVINLSGLNKSIEQIPAQIRTQYDQKLEQFNAQLAQNKAQMSPQNYEKAYEIINKEFPNLFDESFKVDELSSTVINYFHNNFDQQRILLVLNWLRSPLGERLSRLELSAQSPEARQGMINFSAQLQSNPSSQERINLAQRLDEATNSTRFIEEVVKATTVSTMKGLQPMFSDDKTFTEERLEEETNKNISQNREIFKNATLVSFLFTYRSVSDEELMKYIDFSESDAGKRYNKISQQAFLEAISSSFYTSGSKMAGIFKELKELLPKQQSETGTKQSY